jgi:hypothetical protein
MRRFMTKKVAAIGVAGALLVGGGVAFAVIGLQGTGSGSQTVQSGSTGTAPITLSVHITGSPMPGQSNVVSFDATNPNPNPVTVSTISFKSFSSSNAKCNELLQNVDPNQVSMATVTENELIPANTANYNFAWTGTLVWRLDTGTSGTPLVDQDPCLGVPVTLTVQTP